jgi:hypothetical protein
VLLATAAAAPAAGEEALAPEVVVSSSDLDEYANDVAHNSLRDELLVVWHEVDPQATPRRRVRARRLDRYGRPLSAALTIAPVGDGKERIYPAVVHDPDADRYLVVYGHDENGDASDWNIRARFLAWDLAPLGPELTVASDPQSEYGPRVAFSPASQRFLVTWFRGPASGYTIRGAFVEGSAPQVEFLVAESATTSLLVPDVAHEPVGNGFLVVYHDGEDVRGRIVGIGGSVGPEISIAAGSDVEGFPAVASCGGSQFLVAWNRDVAGAGSEVFARFLAGDGTFQSGPIHVAGTTLDEQFPDVGCSGDRLDYLIAYEGQDPDGAFGISARRISTAQTLRPEFAIRPVANGESGVAFWPQVAAGGPGWLASWFQERQGGSPWLDVHARVVWSLFADGFEWGDTSQWSSAQP